MFFFRFHNLQRAEEKRKTRHRSMTKSSQTMSSDTVTAPSRLLERPLSEPIDSMDEIALQIPRFNTFSLLSPSESKPRKINLLLSVHRHRNTLYKKLKNELIKRSPRWFSSFFNFTLSAVFYIIFANVTRFRF